MNLSWLTGSVFSIRLNPDYCDEVINKKYKLLWLINSVYKTFNIQQGYAFYNFEHFWNYIWLGFREFMSDVDLYLVASAAGAVTGLLLFQGLLFVEGFVFLHLHGYLFTFHKSDKECPLIVDWCAWFFGLRICYTRSIHFLPVVYQCDGYKYIATTIGLSDANFFMSSLVIFVVILLVHIILSLIITVAIASLTLVERRVLSVVQRRVGPNHVGYRGRLQFIADALKLLLKGVTIPDLTNRKLFLFVPALSLFVCYTFWLNTVWGSNLSIVELEYNLVYAAIMSACFSICVVLTGIFSRNKYSILAAVRCCCMGLNLEILFGFLITFVTASSESFSFSAAVHTQSSFFYLLFVFLPVLPVILITFLLETNRAPFDLTEAESELVAGYTTELGGFFFALFYLGEYFHLFFFSLTMSLCLLGGWY